MGTVVVMLRVLCENEYSFANINPSYMAQNAKLSG